jgi:hypothetical protein
LAAWSACMNACSTACEASDSLEDVLACMYSRRPPDRLVCLL